MCARYDNLIPREAYKALFRPERLPQSNFPPRYNIAPTDPIPIIRVDPRDGTARAGDGAVGADPGLDEGEAEDPAHQCAGRDRPQAAPVPRGLREAARADPGDRLLRMAAARRRQAALPVRAQRPRALRLCRAVGVRPARRRGHRLGRDHRRRGQSAGRAGPRPHAGDPDAGGLRPLAGRGRGPSTRSAACSGRSTRS